MKFPLQILMACTLILASSCAPLSKSQVSLTRNYFSTVTNYSDLLEDVNAHVADSRFASQQLESLLADDSLKFRSMISAIRTYERELQLPDSIETELDYLNDYVQKYYALIPAGINIYGVIKGAGSSVPGMGLVARLLPNFNVNISSKRKRKVKAHIHKRGAEVQASLCVLEGWAGQKLLELQNIEQESLQNLRVLELTLQKQTDTYEYYAKAQKVITLFYRQVFLTRKVVQNLSESIRVFQNLEEDLRNRTRERRKHIRNSTHLAEMVRKLETIRHQNHKIQHIKELR